MILDSPLYILQSNYLSEMGSLELAYLDQDK